MGKLKKGDVIACHDYEDARSVRRALTEQGYLVQTEVGYTIRILWAPKEDKTEQDGFITWSTEE